MKKTVIGVIIMALFLGIMSFSNADAKTYKENKTYTLKGTVKRVKFMHPNGMELKSYVIVLKKKIRVKSWIGTVKAKQLDISINSKSIKKKLKKKLGKIVSIKGSIYAPGTAWYYNQLTISPSKAKHIR